MPRWIMRWDDPLPTTPYVLPNERGIELPLAAEACDWTGCRGVILDAGASLNRRELYQQKVLPAGRIWHYTQSLTYEDMARAGAHASYLCGDLRHLEFADGAFDHVVCVSTLEHIGFDNVEYGGTEENDPGSWRLALHELWRVLKPGGTLFVSVPAGQMAAAAESLRYKAFSLSELYEMGEIVGAAGEWRYFRAEPVGQWRESAELLPTGIEPPQEKQRVIGLACLKWTKPCVSGPS